MATFNHCHSGAFTSVTFRIDEPVYRALYNASMTTGVSMNSLVNAAIAHYVNTTPLYQPIPKPVYRSSYEAAIKKLSGG